jgi:hypothetical protein
MKGLELIFPFWFYFFNYEILVQDMFARPVAFCSVLHRFYGFLPFFCGPVSYFNILHDFY